MCWCSGILISCFIDSSMYWCIDYLVDDLLLLSVFLSQTGHFSPKGLILTETHRIRLFNELDQLQAQACFHFHFWFWLWSSIKISYCLMLMILESMVSCLPFISWTSVRILFTSSADIFTSSWRTDDTWTQRHTVNMETRTNCQVHKCASGLKEFAVVCPGLSTHTLVTLRLMFSSRCSCPLTKNGCWNSVSSLSGFTKPPCSMWTTLRKPSKDIHNTNHQQKMKSGGSNVSCDVSSDVESTTAAASNRTKDEEAGQDGVQCTHLHRNQNSSQTTVILQ